MYVLSFGFCRRRLAWPCRLRCRRCWQCLSRLRKETESDDEDLEIGPKVVVHPRGAEAGLANGQDADELLRPAELPGWQMPTLVVECSQRPGARIPKGTSLILPEAGGDLMASIAGNLPVLLQIRPCWHLGYSMAVDGVSLRTLYRQLADAGPCVLIVEDSSNCIFGAFLSEGLRSVSQCYGSHECFLFRFPRVSGAWRASIFSRTATPSLPPEAAERAPMAEDVPADVQSYSGAKACYFESLRKRQALAAATHMSGTVFCDHTGIVIGIDGPALFIDQDLLRGASWPSVSFASPCLAGAGPDFIVRNLEVWHWGAGT